MIPEYPIGPMPPFFFSFGNGLSCNNNNDNFGERKTARVFHKFEKFNLPEEFDDVFEDDNKNIIDPPVYPPKIRQLLFVDPGQSPEIPLPPPTPCSPIPNPMLPFSATEFWIPEDNGFKLAVTEFQCDDNFSLM